MKVVFLDFDGVVNTPLWDPEGRRCRFGMPEDGKVNNFQSVQWVSEFCQMHGYDIVVTSTWRYDSDCEMCLKNGGLRDGIKVLGTTPIFHDKTRGDEIRSYLEEHPEIEEYIIFDDENEVKGLEDHLVLCDENTGFGRAEFFEAQRMSDHFETRRLNF